MLDSSTHHAHTSAMGRTPTKDTPALRATILSRVSLGTPLAQICREKDVDRTIVYDWRKRDAEFDQQFARARDAGFDALADEALSIADNTDEDPASRRVRVETRLKLLAKWDPKRYGDRITQEVSGAGGGPLVVKWLDAMTPVAT